MIKKSKQAQFKELFNSQITTLDGLRTPQQIIDILLKQRSMVVEKASEIAFKKDTIPFIPVIPLTYRSLYDLIAMVRNNNMMGLTYINSSSINYATLIDIPYYIYGVESGFHAFGFEQQKRFPLIVVEAIALCVHAMDVLDKHGVCARGSHYGIKNKELGIYLDNVIGRPILDCCDHASSPNYWGYPSCLSRG